MHPSQGVHADPVHHRKLHQWTREHQNWATKQWKKVLGAWHQDARCSPGSSMLLQEAGLEMCCGIRRQDVTNMLSNTLTQLHREQFGILYVSQRYFDTWN